MNKKFIIATIGKSVGLRGEVKLHLHTDFISQFKKGSFFTTSKNQTLKIENYNSKKGVIKFEGISTKEDASKLTNQTLLSSKEESRKNCELKDGEYFWFDIIGCEIIEDQKVLGKVIDIQRLSTNDYLEVKSANDLIKDGYAKSFLIPYIKDIYIDKVDIKNKQIFVKNSFELLKSL